MHQADVRIKGHGKAETPKFIYDFSFIGWILLSMCTLGIVGIFFANPYKYASDAELYLAIRSGEIKTRDTSEEPKDVHVNTFEL